MLINLWCAATLPRLKTTELNRQILFFLEIFSETHLKNVVNVLEDNLSDNREDNFADQELEDDPNARDQLKQAESKIQDWIKDLTLPEKSSKIRKTLTLSEKSGIPINSAFKVSGERNLIPGNKFDRKSYYADDNDVNGVNDGVEAHDVDGDPETDYIVIQDGDLSDDDDYVDLNGPNENDN